MAGRRFENAKTAAAAGSGGSSAAPAEGRMSDGATTPWQGSVTIACRKDAWIVALEGEHDVSTAALVRRRLADARVAEAIIVDLTPTTFIDSSIASALYDAHRAELPRIRFVVAPGTPPRRLFDLIGLEDLVLVHGSLEDALRASWGWPADG